MRNYEVIRISPNTFAGRSRTIGITRRCNSTDSTRYFAFFSCKCGTSDCIGSVAGMEEKNKKLFIDLRSY
jgi:hypothetical protein